MSSLACQNGQFSSEGEFKFSLPFGRNYDYNNILIRRVIDGDTFQLEDGKRVRLIGIDTPEIYFSKKIYQQAERLHRDIETVKILGRKATQFSKKLVEGKRVRLEFDVEKYDKYGRLLAYIYLKDGTFVNEEIVRQGYALVLTIPPNVKYKDVFLKAQRQARRNNRGLWKK
jgi:micrococcal nuclease